MMLFDKRMPFILMKSHQSYFSFIMNDFCVLFRKFLPYPNLSKYFSIFSSISSIVLTFTVRSLYPLKFFVCVSGVSLRSGIILFMWASIVLAPFVEKNILTPFV